MNDSIGIRMFFFSFVVISIPSIFSISDYEQVHNGCLMRKKKCEMNGMTGLTNEKVASVAFKQAHDSMSCYGFSCAAVLKALDSVGRE